MHENMKTSMWHTGRSERTWRLPACLLYLCISVLCPSISFSSNELIHIYIFIIKLYTQYKLKKNTIL